MGGCGLDFFWKKEVDNTEVFWLLLSRAHIEPRLFFAPHPPVGWGCTGVGVTQPGQLTQGWIFLSLWHHAQHVELGEEETEGDVRNDGAFLPR